MGLTTVISKDLELRPVEIPKDYRKKWNVHGDDFMHLYYKGKLVSNTYYRLGGLFNIPKDGKYFMIIKHIEDYYDDVITKDPKKKPHLMGCFTILNLKGEEKVVFPQFEHAWIVGDIAYVLNDNYYNIETGELYCKSYENHFVTKNFIFINNEYDDDHSKRGVMKISRNDGSYEIFPKE
jgi:hypothetical protein